MFLWYNLRMKVTESNTHKDPTRNYNAYYLTLGFKCRYYNINNQTGYLPVK